MITRVLSVASLAFFFVNGGCSGSGSAPRAASIQNLTSGPDLVSILPLTDRILMVHIDEGYVIHHKKGQKRSEEQVIISPLDTAKASRSTTYEITSKDDRAFSAGLTPTSVGRKSKGTDFAWFVDKYENGQTINERPDHTKEHFIYLNLPRPLTPGKTYQISLGGITKGKSVQTLKFDVNSTRSEAIHVNNLGYQPDAAKKFGYIYHWMGDKGPLNIEGIIGKGFRIVPSGKTDPVFSGKVALRKKLDAAETSHLSDTPKGNFQAADVAECDFSGFQTPGRYVLSVDGIGTSFPFDIATDAYRPAYLATARALYHNRSGIALKAPFTEFTRPAPHHPKLTPNFAGKLKYTTSRFIDWKNEDNDQADKPTIEKGIKGSLDAWGWYQDAGDWDSYFSHLRVAQELLFVYEIRPENFKDGDLNLPESGNGIPDILDEAAWLPRFCHRLRQELLTKKWGTGGISLRVCGDHFGGDGEGIPSYEDTKRTWIVAGEDPLSTFRYAGTAAHLAHALKLAKKSDPEGVDWTKEAIESYAWAIKNTFAKDEPRVGEHRSYAAATLFRLTGKPEYEQQLTKDWASANPSSVFWEESQYGPAVYALTADGIKKDVKLAKTIRQAVLNTANVAAIQSCEQRAMRWGGNPYFPMLVGQQTTPWILQGVIGYGLTRTTDPQKATAYLSSVQTTADYFLGTNALNITWITGVGPRNPDHVFHMDAWYNGKNKLHPGLIPYSPWRKERDSGNGPWDQFWPYKTTYPSNISIWPGAEQYFSNRCSPMASEFTVHQNIGPAAAIYGFLAGPAK